MQSPFILVFAAILFFLLTPGVLLRLPKNGGKLTVALVHAVVFAVVFYFGSKLLKKFLHIEGFTEDVDKKTKK
jgi:lipopolysaccharide export LptBFGC system permease protein LptF